MPRITYVSFDGSRRSLDVSEGLSVMEIAVANGVDGIIGECGGMAMCATCHVYVDPSWSERLPPMSSEEDELLDVGTACDRKSNSRLGCQLKMTAALDGLVVNLPEKQV